MDEWMDECMFEYRYMLIDSHLTDVLPKEQMKIAKCPWLSLMPADTPH